MAVISTTPLFLATISPFALMLAISSLLDFHVIVLLVVFSGVILAVNVWLSPTSMFCRFCSILISVATTVVSFFVTSFAFVFVLLFVFVFVLVLDFVSVFVFEDEPDEVVCFAPVVAYGQTPFVCKCAGCPPQW